MTAEVVTYRQFFVFGEVKKARQFPFVSGLTVEMAVAIVEGYTERANQRKVRLTRRLGGDEHGDDAPDYPVQPGDTLYVFERFF
ncbi:MAG: SLBB domain-containing protein [Methyloceanibacter sp.]